MNRRKWTHEETRWIRENRRSKTIDEMCRHLKCSISTLYRKFQRMRLKDRRHTASCLDEEQLAWLREHFRNTENVELARQLGISESTMHRIARREGLKKDAEYIMANAIKGQEAAKALGKRTGYEAQRIAAKRQQADYAERGIQIPGAFDGQSMRERFGDEAAEAAWRKAQEVRRKNIARDKRRVSLGLEPLGRIIKSVKITKQESGIRYSMKSQGYLVFRGDPVIYYNEKTSRSAKRESFARSIGLSVVHINYRKNN